MTVIKDGLMVDVEKAKKAIREGLLERGWLEKLACFDWEITYAELSFGNDDLVNLLDEYLAYIGKEIG